MDTNHDFSVAICTRGRSDCVRDAVASILADPSEKVHVILVDQNDDDRVVEALRELETDRRLSHVRIKTVGAGRARNVALEMATTDIICFTDDDCTVEPGWANQLTDLLRSHPDVGLVYCAVSEPLAAGRGDGASEGYTPVHPVPSVLHHTTWDLSARADLLGLGAGMAARRQDLIDIGGFDPLMGPGGTFPSADDREIAIRLLLAGRHVMHTPEPEVLHHGFRSGGTDARALTKRDHLAVGAMYAKLLRRAPLRTTTHLVAFLGWSLIDAFRTSLRLRRPAGIGKMRWTIVGAAQGVRRRVDQETLTYVDE